MKYNMAIIGGGPGGYVAAIRAAQSGARVALIEKGNLGGTCLNHGCIPTKSLAAGVSLLQSLRRGPELGISTGGVTVNLGHLIERKNMVVNRLVQGVEYLIKKNNVDLFRGYARLSGKGKISVKGPDLYLELEAENIVLATGTVPYLDKAMGYDGKRVITSDEALNLTAVPDRMLIIGGGVIGCEFASIYAALGSKITIIEILPYILPNMDREISRLMQGLMRRRGITIKTGAKIQEVKKQEATVTACLEGGEEITADIALISTGRLNNLKNIGLEVTGLAIGDRGEVLVNKRMETTEKGIYAVGDIVGKMQLAHVASAQGVVAADNIMGVPSEMDYRVVPSCIFTYPEVGTVGINTQEAEILGIPYKTGKFPFVASGKAQAIGETEGFVKVLAHRDTDKILGVHIAGPRGSDLIAEAALAMRLGATAKQLAQTIHAHPTLTESLVEACEAVYGRSIHM
ncbi:MAG: dihydrolipoyl dehydrogenase [Bacillota bacterium]